MFRVLSPFLPTLIPEMWLRPGLCWQWLAVVPRHDIKWHQTFYQHPQPQLGHCHLSATLQLIRDWEKHFSNTMIISSVIFYIIWHSNWNSVAMNQTSKTENGHRTDEWIKLNEIVVWNGLRTLGFVHKTSSIFGNPRDIIDNGYELSDKNGLFEDSRLRSVGRFYAFIFRQIFLALFMFNSFI